MNRASEIARILLELGAVQIRPDRPFLWASGLRAPLYCDNRLLISRVDDRRRICRYFAEVIAERDWRPEVIAGTATAGIPHAAWLAEALDLPMVYVRGQAKTHGKENRIEGTLHSGASVVLIEDLISTGGSSLSAAQALTQAGAEVRAVLAIFQYGLAQARTRFAEANVPCLSLTSLDEMMKLLSANGRLDGPTRATLQAWQQDPRAWSDRIGTGS